MPPSLHSQSQSTSSFTGDLQDDNVPKPPTEYVNIVPEEPRALEFPQLQATTSTLTSVSDPPPPYRDRRHTLPRHSRYSTQTSDNRIRPDLIDDEAFGDSESSPLLDHTRRRERAVSHSSTTQSFAHNVMSLFQAEFSPPEVENNSFWKQTKRYFRPMNQSVYYAALLHLLVINFPFALVAWIYLFVATFVRPIVIFPALSLISYCRREPLYYSPCPSVLFYVGWHFSEVACLRGRR